MQCWVRSCDSSNPGKQKPKYLNKKLVMATTTFLKTSQMWQKTLEWVGFQDVSKETCIAKVSWKKIAKKNRFNNQLNLKWHIMFGRKTIIDSNQSKSKLYFSTFWINRIYKIFWFYWTENYRNITFVENCYGNSQFHIVVISLEDTDCRRQWHAIEWTLKKENQPINIDK